AYPTVTNVATVSYAGDNNPLNNTARRPTTVRHAFPVTVIPSPTSTARTSPGVPSATQTPTRTPTPTATPTVGNVTATDLSLVKTTGGPFTVGGNGVYLLTVTNVGSGTTNAATTVIDALPSGLSFVSASGSGWTCTASGQTVSCVTGGGIP